MEEFLEKTQNEIQKDVMDALDFDPSISAKEISLSVHEGIVTLRGYVSHYTEKRAAERVAQQIKGVRAVANEIEVKILKFYERSDEDIARVALDALDWNYHVPKKVGVSVEKGWITLTGKAHWEFEKKAAADSVCSLIGVSGVTNNISVGKKLRSHTLVI